MRCNFFPNYKNRTAIINEICKKYKFVNHEIIGESLCKRPIDVLSIGNIDSSVVLCGATHGMEWLTILVLLKFFEECCESIDKKTNVSEFRMFRFMQRFGLVIVPCLNPDGVEIQLTGSGTAKEYSELVRSVAKNTSRWQANARGVDLNHNFDAGWDFLKQKEIDSGITHAASTRYGGEAPFSEPETQAIAAFCKKNHFRQLLSFHSQGREIYYDFGSKTPERAYIIGKLFAKKSGYELSHPDGLAVGGGLKDWFIQEFEKPAFTIEIGKGINPLPIYDLEKEYKLLQDLLCLSVIT